MKVAREEERAIQAGGDDIATIGQSECATASAAVGGLAEGEVLGVLAGNAQELPALPIHNNARHICGESLSRVGWHSSASGVGEGAGDWAELVRAIDSAAPVRLTVNAVALEGLLSAGLDGIAARSAL